MIALPKLMVAPNGARLKKTDHPAVPVTIADIVETAVACHAAGADGIHAHVRDANQEHVLDAGLYLELLSELGLKAPEMEVQITTESVGKYTPREQRALVEHVRPVSVSVALREMISDIDREMNAVRSFYHEQHAAGIAVQHILYDPNEIVMLCDFIARGVVPAANLQLLFVLGRYAHSQESSPDDLRPFVEEMMTQKMVADWAVCAFGHAETRCLLATHVAGGKMRIGFENSIWNMDGTKARNNAERVLEISALI